MGAWIETKETGKGQNNTGVAPYVGAWIETGITKSLASVLRSHPTRVRGLKLKKAGKDVSDVKSHPTWVRGLKLL